jgi:hypothetical protein
MHKLHQTKLETEERMKNAKAAKWFLAGVLFMIACTGGKAIKDLVDSADAGTSDCSSWEYGEIDMGDVSGCDWSGGTAPFASGPCQVPDGWEPFGRNEYYMRTLVRRCLN